MSFPRPYQGFADAKYHKLTLEADGVLLLSFNRPPVNAWIDPKWQELAAILRVVRDDPNVSAIVVAGEGRCFTAGLDLMNQGLSGILRDQPDAARKAYAMRSHLRDFQEAISWFEYCEKPVIAAAHNISYGLGIDIMSACDIRYAAKGTRFSIKEVDAGLAADIGTLQRFPKIIGNDSLARELAYTAKEFSAEEARDMGFLSTVVQGGRAEVVGKSARMLSARTLLHAILTLSSVVPQLLLSRQPQRLLPSHQSPFEQPRFSCCTAVITGTCLIPFC